MISLDSIFENVIAELIIIISSFIISVFIPKLISKVKSKEKIDPLSVALFLELISISNLILNLSFWNKANLTVFLTLTSMALGYLIYYIYNNQCPSCKKFIRAKSMTDDKLIKKFTREKAYQPMKEYRYSNGEFWKEEKDGKEKTRTEHYEIRHQFYKCNFCGFNWNSGQFEKCTDEPIKPRIINTNKKDPNSVSYGFN